MAANKKTPFILVANNPLGHHLLTSQLLDIYEELSLDNPLILICNGVMSAIDPGSLPRMQVDSFASNGGPLLTYFNLLRKLTRLRRQYPDAVYHLRGFVAGVLFFLSRLGAIRRELYIYDPRGAFFIEWREAGRAWFIGRFLRCIEARLVHSSAATIVTSKRFFSALPAFVREMRQVRDCLQLD